jgi:hypothetical protein
MESPRIVMIMESLVVAGKYSDAQDCTSIGARLEGIAVGWS